MRRGGVWEAKVHKSHIIGIGEFPHLENVVNEKSSHSSGSEQTIQFLRCVGMGVCVCGVGGIRIGV